MHNASKSAPACILYIVMHNVSIWPISQYSPFIWMWNMDMRCMCLYAKCEWWYAFAHSIPLHFTSGAILAPRYKKLETALNNLKLSGANGHKNRCIFLNKLLTTKCCACRFQHGPQGNSTRSTARRVDVFGLVFSCSIRQQTIYNRLLIRDVARQETIEPPFLIAPAGTRAWWGINLIVNIFFSLSHQNSKFITRIWFMKRC